jgi:hypothetical protein
MSQNTPNSAGFLLFHKLEALEFSKVRPSSFGQKMFANLRHLGLPFHKRVPRPRADSTVREGGCICRYACVYYYDLYYNIGFESR